MLKKFLCMLIIGIVSLVIFNYKAFAVQSYDFKGTINNKIPVEVWLEINNEIISGEIVYLNTTAKTPIRLLGNFSDHTARIFEMLPDGKLSGVIEAEISHDQLKGTWFNPLDWEKKYSITLSKSEKKHIPFNWKKLPDNILGEYQYYWGGESSIGVINITNQDKNVISFTLNNCSGAPNFELVGISGYNEQNGEEVPAKAVINGQTLIYEVDKTCAVELTFYDDFVVSSYVPGKECLEYTGLRGSYEGIYLKTK